MSAVVAPNTWRTLPTRGQLADDFLETLYSTSSNIRCMKVSIEDVRQLNLSVLRRSRRGPIFQVGAFKEVNGQKHYQDEVGRQMDVVKATLEPEQAGEQERDNIRQLDPLDERRDGEDDQQQGEPDDD
jgi:hypothetical protein